MMTTDYEATAVHEAGHALVSIRVGIPVRMIAIGQRAGLVRTRGDEWVSSVGDRPSLGIAALAAGRIAERLAGLEPHPAAGDDDLDKIGRIAALGARRLWPNSPNRAEAEAAVLVDRGQVIAELLLRASWSQVLELGRWLRQCQTLRGDQIDVALESAPLAPLPTPSARLDELVAAAGDDAALVPRAALTVMVRAATEAELEAGIAQVLREAAANVGKPLSSSPRRPASKPPRQAAPLPTERPAWLTRPAPIHAALPQPPLHRGRDPERERQDEEDIVRIAALLWGHAA